MVLKPSPVGSWRSRGSEGGGGGEAGGGESGIGSSGNNVGCGGMVARSGAILGRAGAPRAGVMKEAVLNRRQLLLTFVLLVTGLIMYLNANNFFGGFGGPTPIVFMRMDVVGDLFYKEQRDTMGAGIHDYVPMEMGGVVSGNSPEGFESAMQKMRDEERFVQNFLKDHYEDYMDDSIYEEQRAIEDKIAQDLMTAPSSVQSERPPEEAFMSEASVSRELTDGASGAAGVPVEPASAAEPAVQTEPNVQVDGAGVEAPKEPVMPAVPEAPAAPAVPAEPAAPAQLVAPVVPAEPAAPVAPAAPAAPAEPAAPAGPEAPVAPAEPAAQAAPVEVVAPVPDGAEAPAARPAEGVIPAEPLTAKPVEGAPSRPQREDGFNPLTISDFSVLRTRPPICSSTARKPKTFLMVMSSHTGSTALMSILRQHPEVGIEDLEIFEPLNQKEFIENATLAVEWTRNYFQKGVDEGRVVGFKLSGYPIMRAKEQFAALVEEFDTRVIWNYRLDIFKRAVGRYPWYFMGDETSVSGISSQELANRCDLGVGCHFNIDSIDNLHCTMTRGWRVHLGMDESVRILTKKIGGDCVLHVDYHDFLQYPHHVSMQMQDFLGLSRVDIESLRAKATSDNMCDVITNYADMCAAFNECSDWHEMLNDRKNGCTCDNYEYTSLGGDGVNKYCTKLPDPNGSRWCGLWPPGT